LISTVSLQSFFKLADGSRTRHKCKLVKEHSRCDVRLHFFLCESSEPLEQSVPQSVVQVNSVHCFKNQLDKLRINQMDFFMDD